jgi:hypothetical protein
VPRLTLAGNQKLVAEAGDNSGTQRKNEPPPLEAVT